MPLSDALKIPIKCPKCGRKITKRLGQLHRNDTFRCVCGAEISVSGHQQAALDVKKLEKSVRDLGKKLR